MLVNALAILSWANNDQCLMRWPSLVFDEDGRH